VEAGIANGPNSLDVDGKLNRGSTVHHGRNAKFELDHFGVFSRRGFGPVAVVVEQALLCGSVV
jgi:hypothetical protein